MYNGVGLPTARGTGTSAHVQRNSAALRRPRSYAHRSSTPNSARRKRVPSEKDKQREVRRRVEVEVAERENQLQNEGAKRDQIDTELDELRERLLREMTTTDDNQIEGGEKKQVERNEKLKKALGLPDEYEEGAAFRRMKKNVENKEVEQDTKEEKKVEETPKIQPLPGIDADDSESSSSLSSSSLSESSGIESLERKNAAQPTRIEEDAPPPPPPPLSAPVPPTQQVQESLVMGRRAKRYIPNPTAEWLKQQQRFD